MKILHAPVKLLQAFDAEANPIAYFRPVFRRRRREDLNN